MKFSGSKFFCRALRRGTAAFRLSRHDTAKIPASGPLVFAVVRNESLRLPRFLQHYRRLGASGFVVVENNSTDGTQELLRGQSDVVLYRTRASFVRKEAWLDLLLRRHGTGRWCVVADADELLDFPGRPEIGLPGLASYLDAGRWNTLHAMLLDLYPAGPVGSVAYRPGEDYFDHDWYFDPPASMRRTPRAFWKGSGLDYRFEGGVRERVFGVSNCCSKFPFFKFGRGMYLHDGQHYLEGAHVSPVRGVLYHFKYLQDFVPHACEEVQRGQHWKGAAEYRRYAEKARASGGEVALKDASSVRFAGGEQMLLEGVTVCPPDLRLFVDSRRT